MQGNKEESKDDTRGINCTREPLDYGRDIIAKGKKGIK
jgi:hypothetical protein